MQVSLGSASESALPVYLFPFSSFFKNQFFSRGEDSSGLTRSDTLGPTDNQHYINIADLEFEDLSLILRFLHDVVDFDVN